MGPNSVGDEFDENEEEAKTDPETIYDTITVSLEGQLGIVSVEGTTLTIEVDGEDVRLRGRVSGEEVALDLVVPRTALVEALADIGVLHAGPTESAEETA